MGKNNIKVISSSEMEYLNSRYSFSIEGNQILVKIKNYNRVTAHPANASFSLNTKVRKLDITPEAVKLWNDSFKDKHSLFEVQNAINILISTYQTPSFEEVAEQLKRGTAEIKTI